MDRKSRITRIAEIDAQVQALMDERQRLLKPLTGKLVTVEVDLAIFTGYVKSNRWLDQAKVRRRLGDATDKCFSTSKSWCARVTLK